MGFHRSNTPTSKTLVTTIVIEFLGFLIVAYPLIHIYVFLGGNPEPTKRGFFCDDESLRHPIVEQKISTGQCFMIWAAIVFIIVVTVELLYHKVYATSFEAHHKLFSSLPWVYVELYRILGAFSLGCLFTYTTTELAKFQVGRLRPYFLTLCNPDLSRTDCFDGPLGLPKYVENYNCTTTNDPSGKELRDAKKSFFSGHSSFSFYCATFLIVFLHARLSEKLEPDNNSNQQTQRAQRCVRLIFRCLRILRPFLQFGIFVLAFFICLTRLTDYKHHPTDVITGALIGVIYALILLMFVIKIFHNPVVFHFRGNDGTHTAETGTLEKCNIKGTTETFVLSNSSSPERNSPLNLVA